MYLNQATGLVRVRVRDMVIVCFVVKVMVYISCRLVKTIFCYVTYVTKFIFCCR